jgi:hypothetical protein
MRAALRTFVLGGVLGAGVVSGGALAFAQSGGTTVPPAAETPGTAPGTTTPGTVPDGTPGTTPPTTKAPDAPGAPGDAEPGEGCDPGSGRGGKGHGRAGGGARGGVHLGASADDLAKELGVTTDKLNEAVTAGRQALQDRGEPVRPSTRPPSDEEKAKVEADRKARAELFQKTVAEKLGVTPERLREAGVAVVSKRLDEAVTAGRLTREKADELLAKVRESGVPLLGGHGGHGGPGGGRRGPR